MPSYRHRPLSQRLGLSFSAPSYWRVEMPEAECFMYFVAGLGRIFGRGYTLYIEGRNVDAEVAAAYEVDPAKEPAKMTVLDRHPSVKKWQVAMGPELGKALNRLAACKTYAQICDTMVVHKDGKVLMDGSRLGERIVRFDPAVPEADLRRFVKGKLRGVLIWVEG